MELAARLGGRGGLSAASIERNRQQSVIAAGEAQRAQERAGLATAGKQKGELDRLKRNYEMRRMGQAEQMAAAAQQNLFNVEDNQANLGRNFATSLIDSAMPLLGSIGGGGGAGAGAASTSGSGLNLGSQMMGSFDASGGYQFPTGGFGSYNFGGFGEKGMKTPGEFSHESNPINLMQNGSKVGEVTGGEYVVNPSQAKKIAEQSAYARMLFKKFDKKA